MNGNSSKSYLLDTHVIMWMINDSSNLTEQVKNILLNTEHDIYFSLISLWEIAIKVSIGKLTVQENWQKIFKSELALNQIKELSISWKHIEKVEHLPFIHRDPFDRILISQAISENITLISCDNHIRQYDVNVIW